MIQRGHPPQVLRDARSRGVVLRGDGDPLVAVDLVPLGHSHLAVVQPDPDRFLARARHPHPDLAAKHGVVDRHFLGAIH